MRIEIDATPRVNLALQQQAVPLVRSLTLHNDGEDAVGPLSVVLRADPPFVGTLSVDFGMLESGGRRAVDLGRLSLSPSFLARQAERERGALHVEVFGLDGILAAEVHPVEVLAPTQWTGVTSYPELLAAFVRPNARALVPVLQDASDRLAQRLGDGALCGYQHRDPRHAQALVQAVWEAIQARGIAYIDPPASFEEGGQKIRTHEQALDDRLGTCLDLSVMLAAALEQIGLNALVIVIRGHAFVGAWLTPFHLPEAVLDDPLPLRKRVELGEALVVDSSPVTTSTPFAAAVRSAETMLDVGRFVLAVDIAAARKAAAPVRPLPLDRVGDELADAVHAHQTVLDDRALPSDRFRPIHDASSDGDRKAPSRLDRWQQRLLDLSLRNRFLNHKENARSLPIPRADIAALEDALAHGRTFELSPRAVGTSIPAEVSAQERETREQELARGAQAGGSLRVDLTAAELGKQALELHRTSRSALEESGAGVLYLALGFLRWFESPSSDQPRSAPLILVPVELVRPTGATQSWRLKGTDEETRINVTLLEKLRRDFGIDARLDDAPQDEAGLDVPAILHAFRRAVLHQPRWEVVEGASVAAFSFAKFLMWLDLASKRTQILSNPVVRQILDGVGPEGGMGAIPDEAEVARTPPEVLHTVVDADPSQTRALLAAHAGTSFVLQGPPGTGKSQTITNLIAHLLGTGRTVLFVSEKRAALDVVHRRLEHVGLGPFCLELHSDKATRAGVVRQLGAPFELAATEDAEGWTRRIRELTSTRALLDAHAERLAAPTPFGVPLRSVVAELVGLSEAAQIAVPAVALTDLDAVRALEARAIALASAAREAAPGVSHPLHGVPLTRWAPSVEDRARRALEALRAAVANARGATGVAANRLGLERPGDRAGVRAVASAAATVLEGPSDVPRALVDPSGFDTRLAQLAGWAEAGRALNRQREALLVRWRPALFGLDLDGLAARYTAWADVFWLFAFFALWAARRSVQAVAVQGLPPALRVRDDLRAAVEVRDGQRALVEQATSGPGWLGPRFQGATTDWDDVHELITWAHRFHTARLALASRAGSFAATDRLSAMVTDDRALAMAGDTPPCLERTVTAARDLDIALAEAVDALGLDRDGLPEGLDALDAQAAARLDGIGRLRAWCHLQAVAADARSSGLGPLVERVVSGELGPDALPSALARSLREGWWRGQLEADPALASFSGVRHEEVIARFSRLDQDLQVHARQRLVATLVGRLPDLHAPGEEMALLRRQLQLQKRHLPPRRLFAEMPTALRRIKPVVLMSPPSVARFLETSQEAFDVVVFDEASQIPPWDAIGALARARQAVVVGDSKQLPPTSFFDRGEGDDAWVDDNSFDELESILDEASASNLPELRLRWHYRSRHESLITFSNVHYYESSLHTFPSADALAPGVGLELRQLPEGTYDRGGSRTNRPEAEAVVEEIERLLDLPDDQRPTVGVVTFSMAQQRVVEDLVDTLRGRRPELERFFADPEEPVFVKNLENVQGDERDVMLFSVGYGPDRSGKLTMSFGPINRKGGERRLNVAITRARTRLIVFSTLDPARIDLNRTSALGARHLKSFLRFAREGQRALDAESLAEAVNRFESPFEQQVYDALVAAGHTVHTQIGCSGYRIDLGVVDPDRPGTYRVGIECDGATYHGSRSARERDRLRQGVLEQLGWRLIRVWSTDWWHDRRGQTERLLTLVEQARAPSPTPAGPATPAPTPPSGPSLAERLASAPTVVRPDGALPWPGLPDVLAGGPKEALVLPASRRVLSASLLRVVAIAGPVQKEQVFRHIARAWGLQGLGKRIVAALDDALLATPESERPVERDGFLWPARLDPASWRTFRTSVAHARTAQEVPPEELANAAAWVLERAMSIGEDALIAETARTLGWTRVARNVQAACAAGLAVLERDGRAVRRGERWVRPD